ncbi:polysaccharide lyase family 7 protein [Cellulophaga baltica]|uniref:polysaccharide lyase family 7 protein n=1 Tax=Cellulophaga TaxID=104264 RepID=UPI001C07B066|nr:MULTISPECIES: polysaccharide lyase family 7 protein [Cellulophaga]MBU2996477.1 polysaccharide lyase family 7 protein [Cellulophaga baltica]MDO6767871.1 polysaccharide lyase family 7 protein [Cellulophaga sp. 1_MG-2023]
MNILDIKRYFQSFLLIGVLFLMNSCSNTAKKTKNETEKITKKVNTYPSDVIPFMKEWKILLGDGTHTEELVDYAKDDFFYVEKENDIDWVVYKTPNSGITSKTSSNTRTELGQKKHWIPETGGKLTGTLKVKHVSTSGDARVAASYSVVVGQIHSDEGHENEPIKIFYKKFPGHTKGSVFWNYEINTEGDNSGRWDYSTAIWGDNMSVVGETPDTYPEEPQDGIALGEEFSYEINVYKGIMYLTFTSDNHKTVKFTKNLLKSDFSTKEEIPEQIWSLYAVIGRDGVERENAYAGEIQYFKQGAYNQTNGKSPDKNIVWSTGSETYGGDIAKQYANGCYAEVWFKEATVGEGTDPNND